LTASRQRWNALAGDHPFLNWEWMYSWWQAYGGQRQAAVLVVEDENGRWVGLFPLCIERRRYWGRVLVNMGSGRACSDHIAPIVSSGVETAARQLMVDWIVQQAKRGAIDLIDLDGVDAADGQAEPLFEMLQRSGFLRVDTAIESSWITPLPSDWDTFEKSIKKCFRRKLQKARRNEHLPGIEVRLLDSEAAIREYWPEVVRLHAARRAAMSQVGCFDEEGFPQFLLSAIIRMLERGAAAVVMATHHGVPFGMTILLFAGNRAYLYQSGFDPAQRSLEPGHLVATSAVRLAIERGCSHFDFLRGDEPYKARWNAVPQPMLRVRAAAPRLLPRLRLQMWQWVRGLKKRLSRTNTAPVAGATANESDAE
jgi:CelD/BcsL family acetyltransferase involved in cellulose biosynthesis